MWKIELKTPVCGICNVIAEKVVIDDTGISDKVIMTLENKAQLIVFPGNVKSIKRVKPLRYEKALQLIIISLVVIFILAIFSIYLFTYI